MAIFPPLDCGNEDFIFLPGSEKLRKPLLREPVALAKAADVGGPILDAGAVGMVQVASLSGHMKGRPLRLIVCPLSSQ